MAERARGRRSRRLRRGPRARRRGRSVGSRRRLLIGATRFWERLLGGATAAAVAHPRRTVVLGLALAAAAALLAAARLELRTSNLDLVDPALPEIARFREFAAAFGTPNLLVVVLEGTDPDRLSAAADRVVAAVGAVPGVRAVLGRLPFREDLVTALGGELHFRSRDRGSVYLFVQPDDPDSAAATIAPFVRGVRGAIDALELEREGVRAGFTGLPQYALDDRDFVQRDVSSRSGIAFVLVLLVFVLGFRGLTEPLLAMAVLTLAAAVTAGVAALAPGHLTLVSAFFFSILFGLGIDFGVHVTGRAEELRAAGSDAAGALVAAVRDLAPGLGTGAATTAASFLLLLVSGFRGFAELGWLAGAGVVIALAAMVTVLPAALVLLPRRRRARGAAERRTGRALAALQSPLAAGALVAAAASVLVLGAPDFDADYLDLQPEGSEAVRLERAMVAGSDFAPQFAAFVVPDVAAAEGLGERLRAEPTVAAVRSAADFEELTALGAQLPGAWEAFRRFYVAPDGRHAVYAFPAGDAWEPGFQARFLAAMRDIDPRATGMPFVGRFMVERSWRALRITSALAAILLVAFVAADLRRPLRALLAVAPTFLGVGVMLGAMRVLGLDLNPLNVLALPVVIGVAEDSGVHLVHRFVAEGGDLVRTLAGAGRTVLVCGVTTLVGCGALVGASHRGLASFAAALTLGVGGSLALSLLVLPQLLVAWAPRLGVDTAGRDRT